MAEERSTGKARWFNDAKGFGVITPDNGGEDLFVHQSSIKSDGFRSLAEGDPVEFSIISEDNKGKTKAVDVTAPGGASLQGTSNFSRKHAPGSGGGGWSSRRGGAGGVINGGGGGCFVCGESGYMARNCPKSGGGCYKCGEYGHLARDCASTTGGGGCYNCGEVGHFSGECVKGSGSGGGGGSCFNCGKGGHFARECPNTA